MEGDAGGMNPTAELTKRLEGIERLRRLGQALWMGVGSSISLSSLVWAKGLLGHDGDDVLWAALVEQQVIAQPDYVVSGPRLARLLSRLSGENTVEPGTQGQLVWTLPEEVACPGISRSGYAEAAKAFIVAARRTVTMVSPYLEVKGVGLLTTELLEALHRGVDAKILTHGASEAGSYASTALEELRRNATGMRGKLTVYSSAFDAVLLHPKLLVVDSKLALLGSANVTGRGLSGNFEAGVTLGPTAATEIERVVSAVIASALVVRSFSTRER